MALGLLFRVSWICFVLFGDSAGVPAVKGYGYPYKADFLNTDDGEDEIRYSLDQIDMEGSYSQAPGPSYTSYSGPSYTSYSGPSYTSYSSPSVPEQPNKVQSTHALPSIPSVPKVERIVNGAAREWGQDHSDVPITFPLSTGYQPGDVTKSQSNYMQPQPASSTAASPYEGLLSSGTGGSSHAGSAVYSELEPSSSQANHDLNTDASVQGGDNDVPHLVYEEVFEYPDNAGDSLSYPSFGGASNYPEEQDQTEAQPEVEGPASPSFSVGEDVFSSTNEDFYQPVGYQPDYGQTNPWPQQPQEPAPSTQEVDIAQHVSEPIFPPPQSSYIIQSRDGYERNKILYTKTSYSPELPTPARSQGVVRPAPKHVKNPQRTKW
ncbi:uncharacterized protein LOC115363655 [Myripristis murdjan]|uniref:uncharacterized protein LOC115363655 n=1 Tax=Myripristis murdjan TaxID=586833 RepID=UPI001175D441|nr:uncharacterized protein LOC115363655 [Myripristis murdjan]